MSISSFETSSYKGTYKFLVIDKICNLIDLINQDNYSIIFIDSKISDIYKSFSSSFKSKSIKVEVKSETKSVEKLIHYLKILSDLSLKRNSNLLVIGGATMQDIFASVCCLYYRGINWSFIPTTLLSQGDSCIGSKTSLDGFGKKNQFGVFYPPNKIYVCSEFLRSLPKIEIFSGIGDILHYLLPYKSSEDIVKNLVKFLEEKDMENLISFCLKASSMAMKIKSELVTIDEFDKGPRKIFNYGHTFAHAIEKASSNYVPHGVAVLCGLYIALNLKVDKSISLICKEQSNQIKKFLEIAFNNENYKLEIKISKLKPLLESDKKNISKGKVRLILPEVASKSIWKSNKFKSEYGLNYIDLDIDDCVTSFNFLTQISGIFLY